MPGAFPFPKEQKLRSLLQAKTGCAKGGYGGNRLGAAGAG